MECISCNQQHEGKFCPNCGEKAEVEPITFTSITSNLFSSVLNMDKGYLFNLKHLSINTRGTIRSYITGKRKGIYNPFSYLFVSIIIYLVVESFLPHQASKLKPIDEQSEIHSASYEAGKFLHIYFKYFWITSIIWLSLITKLFFSRFNFAEHLAINAFIIGHATLLSIIGLLLFNWKLIFVNPIIYLVIGCMLYKVHADKSNARDIPLQTLASILFFFMLLSLVIGLIIYLKTF